MPWLLKQRGEGPDQDSIAFNVKTKFMQEKELGLEWEGTSWKQYSYRVARIGRALIALGIEPSSKAIMLGQTKVVRRAS